MKREWTDKEITFLKDNIDKSNTWIAEQLNRSILSIRNKKSILGIRVYHKWTSKELKFIKENYPKMNSRELAKILGLSVYSVKHFILANNITKRTC